MPEEQRDDRALRQQDERSDSSSKSAPQIAAPVKKKKRGKGSFFFMLLLLSFGVGTGLHFSGLWDARALIWGTVPKIPYLGRPLAQFFEIPEQYTLTVAERRAFELEEWQKRLTEKERTLSSRESTLDIASGDVGIRSERLSKLEAAKSQEGEQGAKDTASEAEKKLINQVAKTYQDISPRNAAQIVEQLREGLAVELLQKLPVDARAAIMSKMDPKKAARLTEYMATSK